MMKSVARYKEELEKKLLCSRKDKEKLLGRFEDMLNEFLAETPSPSREQLEDAFGPPENMAQALLAGVTTEDFVRYQKRHQVMCVLVKVLLGITLAVSMALTAKLYLDSQRPVVVEETIIIEETIPVAETEVSK